MRPGKSRIVQSDPGGSPAVAPFVQKQLGECDKKLEKYMAALPTRTVPESVAEAAEDGGKKKSKKKKGRNNLPKFDLHAKLNRVKCAFKFLRLWGGSDDHRWH